MSQNSISIADVAAPQLPDSGDFIYRITQPGRALGSLPGVQAVAFTTICLHRERLLLEPDVLVIHMIGDLDLLPVVLERRRRKKLTVFEVSDNFMDFQKSNPAAAFYEVPANRACLIQLLRESDAMQTTVPELEKRFAGFNPRCRVFMNGMAELGNPERAGSDKVTIGWGGSIGHYEDIRRIAPPLIEWLKKHPDATFAIMADRRITTLFDELPPDRKRIVTPGSLHEYYEFVQTLDIGIAPVRDEEFNLCRSDVKFLEYASRGAVPVCSRVPTYSGTVCHGETGFMFDTDEEMLDILEALVADEQLRRRVGGAAFEYARLERSEAACVAQRLEYYLSLISELGCETAGPLHGIESIPGAVRSPGTAHFLMGFGRVETLIHDGLMNRFRAMDGKAALKLLGEAAALAPDFYPARNIHGSVLAGSSQEDAIRELTAAHRLCPNAPAAAGQLAMLLFASGHTDKALALLHEIQAALPENAAAWAYEGDIMRETGRLDEAMNLYARALEANPFHTPASTMSGAICLSKGDFESAIRMFSRSLETVPRSAGDRMGLGAALMPLGRFDDAADQLETALALNPALADAARLFLDVCKNDYKKGALESGISRLMRLHELCPGNAEAVFWLARSLDRAGRTPEAVIYWRVLIKLDDGGKYAEIAKTKI